MVSIDLIQFALNHTTPATITELVEECDRNEQWAFLTVYPCHYVGRYIRTCDFIRGASVPDDLDEVFGIRQMFSEQAAFQGWETLLTFAATEARNEPGIYMFKDQLGRPVYIGKADRVKKRLSEHVRRRSSMRDREYILQLTDSINAFYGAYSAPELLEIESWLIRHFAPIGNLRRASWGSVVISTLIHAKGILQVTGNT